MALKFLSRSGKKKGDLDEQHSPLAGRAALVGFVGTMLEYPGRHFHSVLLHRRSYRWCDSSRDEPYVAGAARQGELRAPKRSSVTLGNSYLVLRQLRGNAQVNFATAPHGGYFQWSR